MTAPKKNWLVCTSTSPTLGLNITTHGQGVGRDTKFANHIALIRDKRRVILTDSDVDESKDRGGGRFQRKPKPHGYLGVCEIKDFVFDDTGMHLVFADRLPEA